MRSILFSTATTAICLSGAVFAQGTNTNTDNLQASGVDPGGADAPLRLPFGLDNSNLPVPFLSRPANNPDPDGAAGVGGSLEFPDIGLAGNPHDTRALP